MQERMFLCDLEASAHPAGPYADVIDVMRRSGTDVEQILHLFACKPERTTHLGRFTQEVMRGASPLSAGFRELIAAFVSSRNQCPFWIKSHAAVAAELLTEDLVAAVLNDLETAPLTVAEKALLRFVDKTNRHSTSVSREDIVQLHEHGWTDEAIYDAITVCALFNFYNRWVDASGVHAMSDEAHRAQGKQMAEHGYMGGPEE